MAIQTVGAASNAVQTGSKTSAGQITRDDFMKLLITQLQNQDPLNPMDNQEFAAQLATFNSLEQLVGVNEKLEGLATQQLGVSRVNSAALLGKQVVGNGNQVNLGDRDDAVLHYDLGGNATKVTIRILDSTGALVREIESGGQKFGAQIATWDGKNSLGQRTAAGVYAFEVSAIDAMGNNVGVATQVRGMVTGIDLAGAEPMLEVGQLRIPLSSVVSIH
jgi:flagellar basal-body rod modification protein FlgD